MSEEGREDMKKLFIALVILAIALPVSAAVDDTHTITLETVIPEDWAVAFPHALHLDKLFFAERKIGDDYSLLAHSDIDAGISSGDGGSIRLMLLYYGNSADVYDVEFSAESDAGFVHEEFKDEAHQFPLDISFEVPEVIPDGVAIAINQNEDRAALTIQPNGPVSGLRVLDMILSWDGTKGLYPGDYYADVELLLETR